MNALWKSFLEARGANFESGTGITHFDREAAPGWLCDLSHLGLLAFSGSEVIDFLQGQLSNDMQTLTEGQSLFGSYCNPKGRMFCTFHALYRDDTLLMVMPQGLVESVGRRLAMFVLRADVKVGILSEELVQFGASVALMQSRIPAVGELADGEVLQHEGLTLLRRPGDRIHVIAEPAVAMDWWGQLSDSATEVSGHYWELLEIRAGIPVIQAATSEAFVPQMTNLDLVDGLSFTKGCYPGQEIVARSHYLGKLKRRMLRVSLEDACPAAGDPVFGPKGDQAIGQIVAAEAVADGCEALAVMRLDAAEQARVGSVDGPQLGLLDLPYGRPGQKSGEAD